MANTFVWKAKNFNVSRKAENGVAFKSDSFEMHGANWYLECYPNGNGKKNEGHVSIFLYCSKLPNYTKEMEVYYEFSIVEANWTRETTQKYSQDHLGWGWVKTITNKQLQSLNSFTITCTIEFTLEQLMEIKKQQINALQTENTKLTQQISKSTEEIDEVNKNAYIHSNIITEQELDDMNSDNDEEKQFNDLKEYNELFDRHKAILKEWNVNTMKLDHTTQKKQRSRPGSASISVFDRIEIALQVAKGINHLQLKDINDDEKKQNNDININTALNGLQLWRKNVECNATINEQTNRFSTIASDG
eukprot:411648_1